MLSAQPSNVRLRFSHVTRCFPEHSTGFPDSIIDSDVKRAEFVSEPKLGTLP